MSLFLLRTTKETEISNATAASRNFYQIDLNTWSWTQPRAPLGTCDGTYRMPGNSDRTRLDHSVSQSCSEQLLSAFMNFRVLAWIVRVVTKGRVVGLHVLWYSSVYMRTTGGCFTLTDSWFFADVKALSFAYLTGISSVFGHATIYFSWHDVKTYLLYPFFPPCTSFLSFSFQADFHHPIRFSTAFILSLLLSPCTSSGNPPLHFGLHVPVRRISPTA